MSAVFKTIVSKIYNKSVDLLHSPTISRKYLSSKYAVIAVSLIFLLLVNILNSYSWIYYGKTFEPFAVSTENGYPIAIHKFENSGWVACKTVTEKSEGLIIEKDQFDFGKIDNITVLKPENIIYLRVTLPAEAGKYIRFSINTDKEIPFTVYKDGVEITGITDILKQKGNYLEYYYCFSDYETMPDISLFNPKADVTATEINNKAITSQYLFIGIQPKLETYISAVDTLMKYMPCTMKFNITSEFEIAEEEAFLNE